MNDRPEINARLDASLAAQVRVPRLDRQFDAAVWRRINAAKAPPARNAVAPMRGGNTARWLRACNAAGVMVAVVLLGYFGLRQVSGVASEMLTGAAMELPQSWLTVVSWVVTGCALAFGLRFTAIGKRLRDELF